MSPAVRGCGGRCVWAAAVVLIAVGGGPERAVAQTEPPPPLLERPIAFPAFEELTLDNGLRVVVVPYGTQPVVSARLYVRGGRAAEPAGLAGLAGLAAQVLTQGTATRSAEEISSAIEGVGGSLFAAVGQDFLTVVAVSLTDHVELALSLLADVVRDATFPDEEIELARTRTLSALQAELGEPHAIAGRRFASIVFGEEHPYGVAATPGSVRGIGREDLVAFRDRVLQPDGALLLVAGRIEADEVEALVRDHLGSWTGTSLSAATPPAPPERDAQRVYLVHRPGSAQSVVAIGHGGVPPDHPDQLPLAVMNRVLGGGADSRLFTILREEKGWTYDATSHLTRPAGVGSFQVGAEARAEVTDSVVVEILRQIHRIRDEPVPPEELDAARSYLAGSLPLRLETADQVGGQVASTLLLGLPIDDLLRYPERIRAVGADEVQRAAREHLRPDRAAIVVVGDATRILEPLEPIAEVALLDVEGQPLSRDDVLVQPELADWDPSRLEAAARRYELFVQGNPLGGAEYRLEREGDEWVSTYTVTSMGGSQATTLRFGALDFRPISVVQEHSQAGMEIAVDLEVVDGRLVGRLELPAQLGGSRDVDEALPPGTLLPGMDEYALAIADLGPDARFTIPYLDIVAGARAEITARVTGSEELTVPAGTFDTWRVEVSGGAAPLVLYLRRDAPHILVRQEFAGQPVRLDLALYAPL